MKRTIFIERYEYDNGYFIEAVPNEENIEMWIGNIGCGVKMFCEEISATHDKESQQELADEIFDENKGYFDVQYNF